MFQIIENHFVYLRISKTVMLLYILCVKNIATIELLSVFFTEKIWQKINADLQEKYRSKAFTIASHYIYLLEQKLK